MIVTFLFMEHFLPFSLKLDFLFCDHSHKRNIILLQYLMVIGNGIDSSITSSDSFSFVRYTNLIRFKPINLIAVGNWMFITYHENHISTVLLRLQRTISNVDHQSIYKHYGKWFWYFQFVSSLNRQLWLLFTYHYNNKSYIKVKLCSPLSDNPISFAPV